MTTTGQVMLDPILRVRSVCIRKRRRVLFQGLSWNQTPGTAGWISGANGTGKTSLLRVIDGSQRPTLGTIERVGMPDAATFYHPNLALPEGESITSVRRMVEDLTRRPPTPLDLQPNQSTRRIGSLSTGEQRRLILDGILRRPRPLILLDEPYTHLSPEGRRALNHCIARLIDTHVILIASNLPQPDDLSIGPWIHLQAGQAEVLMEQKGLPE